MRQRKTLKHRLRRFFVYPEATWAKISKRKGEAMNKPITYLAIGDSLTEGVGAVHKERSFVERYFRHIQHTPECKLINLGRSGMVSEELLEQLITSTDLKNLLPEVNEVTISIGGNDLIHLARQNASLFKVYQVSDQLIRNINTILSFIRERAPQTSIGLLGLYLPNVTDNKWLPIAKTYLRKINERYRHTAQSHNALMVDPFDLFYFKPELFADEIHPNDEGYEKITHRWIELKQGSEGWIPFNGSVIERSSITPMEVDSPLQT
jgi:lysophospholipase L1-like esterase